ncbi:MULTISPECIES: sulfate/molybdate ABC transporter ATP-binding protein [unclassified Microbacterium]|uniref:sulfate/molybdate ABC transporter ATP-binding protein n=1 Tax=unclassified Microbacterium TaxID=2609290 RepID=UPI0030172EA5
MTLSADIRCRTGGFALEVALRAEPGEVVAVLGPNGSGKSTLLGAIAGHRPDAQGTVTLGTETLGARTIDARVPAEERRIGLLGQRALLFPHLTALENVAFGPRAQGVGREAARERARAHLAAVGLESLAERRPHQLSGGQQQRVAIARALAAGPDALLLDEPFSALDALTATQVRRIVAELRDRVAIPIVLVTHDAMDAVVLAARTIVLREGRVEQEGPTAEVLGHPRSPFVAAVAGLNLLRGTGAADGALTVPSAAGPDLRFRGHGAALAGGAPGSAAFAPAAVRLRPLAAGADGVGNADNAWAGTIELMEPAPGGIRLTCREAPEIAVTCPSSTAAALGVATGTRFLFDIGEDEVSVRSSE